MCEFWAKCIAEHYFGLPTNKRNSEYIIIKILTSSAVISVDKTVSALIASRADTLVRAIGVLAGSTIAAWGGHETLVYIFVAQAACIADTAGTREVQEVGGWRAARIVVAPMVQTYNVNPNSIYSLRFKTVMSS